MKEIIANKENIAVCGLYCGACRLHTLYTGTWRAGIRRGDDKAEGSDDETAVTAGFL